MDALRLARTVLFFCLFLPRFLFFFFSSSFSFPVFFFSSLLYDIEK
jgi:hypothetical protein